MNTSPDTTRKETPPFAAVLHFKRGHFYQQKHKSWTFRSDWVSPIHTPIHKQFTYLESFVLKEMKGTYLQASIFNNVGSYLPYGEEVPKNNLVLYLENDRILIDRRHWIDTSFLYPTFDKSFLEYLACSFEEQKYFIDLQAERLPGYAKMYREALNIKT
jgi:hypothetical protein